MAMIISDKGGEDFKPIDAGIYTAGCIQVVDIGNQEITYQGKTTYPRKVILVFEIPELLIEIENKETGIKAKMPKVISRTFTASTSEKSALRPVIESWRGKVLTSDEALAFDIHAVCGKACQLQIIHSEDGKYANIKNILPPPKGTKYEFFNPLVKFELTKDTLNNINELYPWMQEKIKKSVTYQELLNQANDSQGIFDSMGQDELIGEDEMPF